MLLLFCWHKVQVNAWPNKRKAKREIGASNLQSKEKNKHWVATSEWPGFRCMTSCTSCINLSHRDFMRINFVQNYRFKCVVYRLEHSSGLLGQRNEISLQGTDKFWWQFECLIGAICPCYLCLTASQFASNGKIRLWRIDTECAYRRIYLMTNAIHFSSCERASNVVWINGTTEILFRDCHNRREYKWNMTKTITPQKE